MPHFTLASIPLAEASQSPGSYEHRQRWEVRGFRVQIKARPCLNPLLPPFTTCTTCLLFLSGDETVIIFIMLTLMQVTVYYVVIALW